MEYFTVNGQHVYFSSLSALEYVKEGVVPPCKLLVFAHPDESRKINLFREISGEEHSISSISAISAATEGCVIAGAYLYYGSIRRLSAVVCHKGSLVDIADAVSVSPPFTPSGTVKIYRNGSAKFALTVGGDGRVPFVLEKLRGRCDFVLSLEPEYSTEKERRVRSLAQELALPFVYVSPARCFFAPSDCKN